MKRFTKGVGISVNNVEVAVHFEGSGRKEGSSRVGYEGSAGGDWLAAPWIS